MDLPPDFDSLIALAIRTRNRISQLRQQGNGKSAVRVTGLVGPLPFVVGAASSLPLRWRDGAHAAVKGPADARRNEGGDSWKATAFPAGSLVISSPPVQPKGPW